MTTTEQYQIINDAILLLTRRKIEANKKFTESVGGCLPLTQTVEIEKECNEGIKLLEKIKKEL
jgi:hypothetical protein